MHKPTGLLVSSYQADGTPLDGPEGSTIWMVAHCLQVVDEPFARDQYQRARRELGRITLGFGYGVEWPTCWQGPRDIDSGAIIPGFEVSAGSSGMALMAASSFHRWGQAVEKAGSFACLARRLRQAHAPCHESRGWVSVMPSTPII